MPKQLVSEAREAIERLEVSIQEAEQLIVSESFGCENLGDGFPRRDLLMNSAESPEGEGRIVAAQRGGAGCSRKVRCPLRETDGRMIGDDRSIDRGLHLVPGLNHCF